MKINTLQIIILLAFGMILTNCGKPNKNQNNSFELEVRLKGNSFAEQLQVLEQEFQAVQFKKGSYKLPQEASATLNSVGLLMNQHPAYTITVVGHTSVEGTAKYNQKLSENRAKAVVDYLIKECNIPSERIAYEGKGSSELKDAEHPRDPINRRTEFVVNQVDEEVAGNTLQTPQKPKTASQKLAEQLP